MSLALVPGGRIFEANYSSGFLGWPAGGWVFGRTAGTGISIWNPAPAGLAMRRYGASPGYNGCFCPADTELISVTGFLATAVLGSIFSGDSCYPCGIVTGPCVPCSVHAVCADCGPLSGPGVGGNLETYSLTGLLGEYQMEAIGFDVTGGSFVSAMETTWSAGTMPYFTGPDGVIFPGNTGPGSSHMAAGATGGHIWMGKWEAGDGSLLYVTVVGGAYPVLGVVPGWTSAMVTNGIGGLFQVFTLGPLSPGPGSLKIAFGHAANCNAYAPIAWGSGSFSAPGNGLLIGDPTQGTIPS